MSGGFGAGFLKGAVVALIGLAAVSLIAPQPQRDPGQDSQTALATPPGSGFNAERRDTSPVLPAGDQGVAVEDTAPRPAAADTESSRPDADTASADRPAPQAGVAALGPADDGAADSAPAAPAAGDAGPERDAMPPALGMPAPEVDAPVTEIPVNRLPTVTPPATSVTQPVAGGDTGDSGVAGTGADGAEDSGVTRLAGAAPGAETGAGTGTEPAPATPFARFRLPFTRPEGRPLMAVILIDAGEAGLDAEVLTTFSFPVTFALDPNAPGVTARAKAFRAAGNFEIAALAPIAASGLAKEHDAARVRATLTAAFARLPEAIALVDEPEALIQQTPGLGEQVVAVLAEQGRGLVTYDLGLNTTGRKARAAGIPAGTVFRVLDADRESGIVIKRYLDRAALEARKTGAVIVLGHTYPETVTALFSWALSAKAGAVALAPLSAVLAGP